MQGVRATLYLALVLALAASARSQKPAAPAPAPAPSPARAPAPPPPPPPPPFVWQPWMRPLADADANKGLQPQRLQSYKRTHYYQLPPGGAKAAKGLVVFLHGCAREARAFFPQDPKRCKECVGLPEHLSHTKQALAAGYAVLALDPHDSKHDCWSSTDRNGHRNDQPLVIDTVAGFQQAQGLAGQPLYLWGASSGGTLALKLPRALQQRAKDAVKAQDSWREAVEAWEARAAAWNATQAADAANATALLVGNATQAVNATQPFKPQPFNETRPVQPRAPAMIKIAGIISEVSAPEDFGAFDGKGRLQVPGFPPTALVVMERDGSLGRARAAVEGLQAAGVPAGVLVSPVRNVSASFFAKRSPLVSYRQSEAVAGALQAIGLLAPNGTLLADPAKDDVRGLASYRWSERLREALPWVEDAPRPGRSPALSLSLRTSSIRMALYVAYAQHDAVSDYFTACLRFLEGRGQEPLEALARRWRVPGGQLSALTAAEPFAPKGQEEQAGNSQKAAPAPEGREAGEPPAGAAQPAQQGGKAQGGKPQAGKAQGKAPQGGKARGKAPQGGKARGKAPQGGKRKVARRKGRKAAAR